MSYDKSDLRKSWEAHREMLAVTFQKRIEKGQGMTEADFLISHRAIFEAGANAMLDSFQAAYLQKELDAAEAERSAPNVIPLAGASRVDVTPSMEEVAR